MKRFDAPKLKARMLAEMARRDVDPVAAEHVVGSVIETSLRGVDSHGINLFPHYARAVAAGRIDRSPQISVVKRQASSAVIDAGNAFGHHVGSVATELAREMADETGLGAVAVGRSSHFGAAAYFALPMARRGYLACSFTNADTLVRAFGSSDSFFGTNPICLTAPMAGEDPFCLDMATSTVSWNKVLNYRRSGEALGEGWAADGDGLPTTAADGAAMLQPVGGYKGFGLGFMVEILCGMLADGPVGPELLPMFTTPIEAQRSMSHFFLVLRIDAFVPVERFAERLTAFARRIRELPAEAGNDQGVMIPGDPEKRKFAHRTVAGIPIDDSKLAEFLDLDPGFEEALVR